MPRLKFMIAGLLIGLLLGIVGALYLTEPEIKTLIEYKQAQRDTLYVDVPADPIHIVVTDTKIIRDTIRIESDYQDLEISFNDYVNDLTTQEIDSFPLVIDGTNLYISPPLTYAIQNRVIEGDTLSATCAYPRGEFEFMLKQKPMKVQTVEIKTFVTKPVAWYDETWFRITTHSTAILLTALVVK